MKAELRKRMRALRGSLDLEELERRGAAVQERVLALPQVEAARSILCFVSVRREIPTRGLLTALASRLSVPRVVDAERMEARAWQEPLVPGVLGIPTSDGPVVRSIDLVLCPGLAFDPHGNRLGYGAGYYDRFLNAHPAALCVGLCLDEALLDQVPATEHDHPMAIVVTPTRTLYCGSQSGANPGSISR